VSADVLLEGTREQAEERGLLWMTPDVITFVITILETGTSPKGPSMSMPFDYSGTQPSAGKYRGTSSFPVFRWAPGFSGCVQRNIVHY
jgi:hypothetical protein